MFATQTVYNAGRAAHALRSDQKNMSDVFHLKIRSGCKWKKEKCKSHGAGMHNIPVSRDLPFLNGKSNLDLTSSPFIPGSIRYVIKEKSTSKNTPNSEQIPPNSGRIAHGPIQAQVSSDWGLPALKLCHSREPLRLLSLKAASGCVTKRDVRANKFMSQNQDTVRLPSEHALSKELSQDPYDFGKGHQETPCGLVSLTTP